MDSSRFPGYEELRQRLEAAESELQAIRDGHVDSIVGERETFVVRLATAEARQSHLKQVLLAIRNVNQLIVAEDDPRRLIERACMNLTETMGYYSAWIAVMGGEAARGLGLTGTGPVAVAAAAGFDGGFGRLRERLERGDFPGCLKRALASEGALVMEAPVADCPDCPLSGEYGGRAGLVRRLEFEGVTYGMLTASVPAAYAHDAEEQSLFNEVAGDLAFALHKIAVARKLEASRRHMAFVIEGAGVGTWEWNVQTNETRFSDQWVAMLGYTLEELTPYDYTTWERLVHPEDLEQARQALADCIAGKRTDYACEFRMQHKVGRWVWILDRGRVMTRDDAGQALAMFGTHTDITEIKQAEAALARQLRFEQAVAKASTCLVKAPTSEYAVRDALTSLLDASRVSRVYIFENFEDPAEGLCMRQVLEVCAPSVMPANENPVLPHLVYSQGFERWRDVLSAGDVIRGHVSGFPDKEREVLESQGIRSLLVFPLVVNGTWWGFVGFDETRRPREWRDSEVALLRTIADLLGSHFTRQQVQERLERVAAELKLAQRMSKVGNWFFDPAAGVPQWSEEVFRIYERDPALGPLPLADYATMYSPEYFDVFRSAISAAIADGTPYNIELRLRLPSGSEKWITAICDPLPEKGPAGHCLLGTIQDITERKQAEETLQRSRDLMHEAEVVARIGAWEWDVENDKWTFSDAWLDIHGMSCGEMTSEELLTLAHPDDLAAIQAAFEKVCAGEDIYDIEHRIIRQSDSQVRFVKATGKAVFDSSGKVIAMRGAGQDITERKEAEAELERRNEMLERTESIAHVGSWEWQIEDDRVTWSEELFRMSGRDPAKGAPSFAEHAGLYVAEDMERLATAVEVCATDGTPFEIELRLVRPDGEIRNAIGRGRALRNAEGKIDRLVGSCQDITERKQSEEKLRRSRELMAHAESVASVGAWEWDLLTDRWHFSDEWQRIHGFRRPTAHSDELMHLAHPDDVVAIEAALRTVVQEGALYDLEHRIIRQTDGATRWIHARGEVIKGEDGRVAMLRGAAQDITEKKKAEEALRESERMMRYIVKHDPNALAVYDNELRYIAVSERYLQDYGVTEADVLGRHHYDVFPEMPGRWREVHRRVLAGATERNDDDSFVRSDGSVTYNRWECRPWYRSDGSIAGMITYTEVTTERKRAEEERERLSAQLQQAQKMESVGRLAGGVAHDFNNMLTVILGHAESMLSDLPADNPLRDELDEVRKAAERSANLTRQLLAFARKQTVAPKTLDLNDTIAATLKMLERLIGEDIDLRWKPGSELATVHIDPGQVEQMVANLVVNARDAIGHAPGHITIETANAHVDREHCATHADLAPGDYVLLTVSDDGCGMDAEVRTQVFEPFFTTKGVGEGTGLGLASVYGVVKQNHGFIDIESEPGQGTTFKIYLPHHNAEANPTPDEGLDPPRSRGRETVLLVEDQPAILRMTTTILERQGYTVVGASKPDEAIRLATEYAGDIHLLMTDVVMPEMNGRELAQRVSALYPGARCLFMSGYTADVIAQRGVVDRGVDFLQKPFSTKSLTVKVREVLDRG